MDFNFDGVSGSVKFNRAISQINQIRQKKSKTLLIYNSLGAITRKIIEQGLCQISGEAGNNEKRLFKTG
mgnify:CR=1 FL=1